MSTGSTSNYNIPYPLSTDPVNVAGDIQDLADRLDNFLLNPAFINNININGGSVVTPALTANLFNTNTTTLNVGQAATSINIGNVSGQVNFSGDVNIAAGKSYEVNNVSVLTSTTLGSSVVSSSLTSVGNISTGTWSATTIAVNKGGTGLTSYTVGDIVFASGTTTLARLAGVATGNALISGGVGVAPSWEKIGLTTHVSGTLPVANGGTNSTETPTNGGVAYGNGASYAFTSAGVSNQVLTHNGTTPVWVSSTGTGDTVKATSPTLITPNIGNATSSYLTITGAVSGSEGGEMRLGGAPTYSGIIIDNYAGYYRIIQESPTLMMFSIEDTDINASANRITLSSDVTATPTDNVSITVERGTESNVEIRWNEIGDAWQFTNDGTNYFDIPTSAGGGAGLEAVLMFAGM
jgi:hypothetical protein